MEERAVDFRVEAGGELHGETRVPGDKSISHRSIILGSIAEGITRVKGFLDAEDSLATLKAFRDMGVRIDGPDDGKLKIHGVGLHGLTVPKKPLDLGNSGTSMRLLCGLLAGQNFDVVLTGDQSLSKRPMKRITEPLQRMHARIQTNEHGTAPLHIIGHSNLSGINYEMPVASAQVKSCLLLAGLYAEADTCITEPVSTRDHTERMLAGFSYPIHRNGNTICIPGKKKLIGTGIDIPTDISSAAFFIVGAAIAIRANVTLRHVGINPTRIGIIDILRLMGAKIDVLNKNSTGGEPVADIQVHSSELNGIQIPEELVPLAIDEFPALFIAAACAEGETVLTGASELRVKESDRLQVMADGLIQLGIDAKQTFGGMVITGGILSGGLIDSHSDHRVAMAFAIAALRAKGAIKIKGCQYVNTSFPDFIGLAKKLGLRIAMEQACK